MLKMDDIRDLKLFWLVVDIKMFLRLFMKII